MPDLVHTYLPWWYHERKAAAYADNGRDEDAVRSWSLAYQLLQRIPLVARRLDHAAAERRIEEHVQLVADGAWPPQKPAPVLHVQSTGHNGGVRIPATVIR